MKNKLWLAQIPIIVVCSLAFFIMELGVDGTIDSQSLSRTGVVQMLPKNLYPEVAMSKMTRVLRDQVRPALMYVSNVFSDAKFRWRGRRNGKNENIVVVDIDEDSIVTKGRWPWHRDLTAALIEGVFEAGARTVGLDIVFSEDDPRVSSDLGKLLDSKKLGDFKAAFETDPLLAKVIEKYSDRLVMGWVPHSCQPLYQSADVCPIIEHIHEMEYPKNYEKYAIQDQSPLDAFFTRTPVLSVGDALVNIPLYNDVAKHAGYFTTDMDPDGVIRRSAVVQLMNGKAYPSLALEMARVALGEELKIEFTEDERIKSLSFAHSGQNIPLTPVGVVEYNSRGGLKYHSRNNNRRSPFPIISALDILNHKKEQTSVSGRALASTNDIEASLKQLSQETDRISSELAKPTKKYTPEEKAQLSDQLASLEAMKQDMMTEREGEENYRKLKDAIVMIGLSATGAFDMRAFTFDKNVPGVEGHANLIDNFISGDLIQRGSGWRTPVWLYFLMILGGVIFAYMAQKLEAIPALFFMITVFAGFTVFDVKVLFENYNTDWHTGFLYIEFFSIFVLTVAIKYVMEEKNKKFVRAAFSKYVAPAVVDAIMKDPEKLTVGGERRDLTIMFSDIRSFTTFSERLDAKTLASFLNEYLSIMTEIIFANQGTLDKYIGDAIMAFWGAPLDQAKHAHYACRAAFQMMEALAKNKDRWKKHYDVDVVIGVGVNSGLVSVGNMGSNNNFAYTVIGDHVNLASRLEGLTKYYEAGIMTTRFTFDSIKASGETPPPHRTLDLVRVKGKNNGVELIQILETPMSQDAIGLFDQARALYAQQKWDEAIVIFTKVLELLPTDGPTKMYIERCKRFKVFSPGQDWDGVFEMRSK